MFELQITHKLQTVSPPKGGADVIISKFKTPKKNYQNVHKI